MESDVLEDAKVALESLDTHGLVSCYADDFIFEDAPANSVITDKEELESYYQRLFSLPNVKFSEVTIYDCGDWAALEWTWSGTKPGTDTEYRIRGASIIEIREGKIGRETIYYDPRAAIP